MKMAYRVASLHLMVILILIASCAAGNVTLVNDTCTNTVDNANNLLLKEDKEQDMAGAPEIQPDNIPKDSFGLQQTGTYDVSFNPLEESPLAVQEKDQVVPNSPVSENLFITFNGPFAPTSAFTWEHCIGGTGDEKINSVQQTSDGGFIIAGYTDSADGSMTSAGYHDGNDPYEIFQPPFFDAFAAKLDKAGSVEWVRCIGGTRHDIGSSICQTADGGYVLAGTTASYDGDMSNTGFLANQDAFVARISSAGELEWVKCIGEHYTTGKDIRQTSDGGYILAGETCTSLGVFTDAGYHGTPYGGNYDAYILKLNATVGVEWARCVGGTSPHERGDSVEILDDGTYILTGYTDSTDGDMSLVGQYSGFIAKIGKQGDVYWVKSCPGTYFGKVAGRQTIDGGFITAAFSSGRGYYQYAYDGKVEKLNPDGSPEWTQYIGGTSEDFGYDIHQVTGGSYLLIGYTNSTDGDMEYHSWNNYDGFVAGMNPAGITSAAWVTCYGGSGLDGVEASAILMGEKALVLAGSTNSPFADYHGGSTDAVIFKVPYTPILTGPPKKLEIGIFRAGTWYVDSSGNNAWDGIGAGKDAAYSFGKAGDRVVVGDWNRDGDDEIGAFRAGTWYVDANANNSWDNTGPGKDAAYSFGKAGDQPVVGDWNHDGADEIGVFREGMWFLDTNANNRWDGTGPGEDAGYSFGKKGDQAVMGDWNHDGKPEIGVFRAGTWYVDYNGNNQWDGIDKDRAFLFGRAGDIAVTGNWNKFGSTCMGVFREKTWYVDLNGNNKWDGTGTGNDAAYSFGTSNDLPVTSVWW